MAETFLVDYAGEDGTGAVRFIGELDLVGAARAEHAGLEALSLLNGDGSPLVIDVSELAFCDSTGLRALCTIRSQADARGRAVVLRRPGRALRRLLEIMALSELFVIED